MVNIDSLSFLIGTFKNVIDNFGKTSNSVKFFKTQVDGLVNIGQVSSNDADLIYRLLGMSNTTAVKWNSTMSKLNSFIEVMDYMINAKTQDQAYKLYMQLKSFNKIPNNIDEYIREVHGIKEATLPNRTNSFGKLDKQATNINTIKEDIAQKPLTEEDLINNDVYTLDGYYNIYKYVRTITNAIPNLYLLISNSDAVCSSDITFYNCALSSMLNGCPENPNIVKEMIKGTKYEIAKGKEVDNVRDIRIEWQTAKVITNNLHSFNFRLFFIILKLLKLLDMKDMSDKKKIKIYDTTLFMARHINDIAIFRGSESQETIRFVDIVNRHFSKMDIRDLLNALFELQDVRIYKSANGTDTILKGESELAKKMDWDGFMKLLYKGL